MVFSKWELPLSPCYHSLHLIFTSLYPSEGGRWELEAQKVKIMCWDKNNFLATAMRHGKQTVAIIISITNSIRKGIIHTEELPDNRQYQKSPSATFSRRNTFFLDKRIPSSCPSIKAGSQPYPLPATAKINPVLFGARRE